MLDELMDKGKFDGDKKVTYDGVTKTLSEWFEYFGTGYTDYDFTLWDKILGKDDAAREQDYKDIERVKDRAEDALTGIATDEIETILSELQSALDGLNTDLDNTLTRTDTGIDTLLTDLQSTLDSLNTDSEADNLELQNLVEKRSLLLEQASVFVKSATDATQSVLNNF